MKQPRVTNLKFISIIDLCYHIWLEHNIQCLFYSLKVIYDSKCNILNITEMITFRVFFGFEREDKKKIESDGEDKNKRREEEKN